MELRVGCFAGPLGEAQGRALSGRLSKFVKGADVVVLPVERGDEAAAHGVVFASALEVALMNGEVDIAVRSLHEVGVLPAEDVKLVAVTQRIDLRDAAMTASGLPLSAAPEGTQVIVDGPRRAAQVRGIRPDLGPVIVAATPDRLVKSVAAGDAQAMIVALSDLRWMGREAGAAEIFSVDDVMPAPGQGALGLLVRAGDVSFEKAALAVHHKATWMCVRAERGLFETLGWSTYVPAGAAAEIKGGKLVLRAAAFGPDGQQAVRAEASGEPEGAFEIASRVAENLRSSGAEEIVQAARQSPPV